MFLPIMQALSIGRFFSFGKWHGGNFTSAGGGGLYKNEALSVRSEQHRVEIHGSML